jgi:hypothetical protein
LEVVVGFVVDTGLLVDEVVLVLPTGFLVVCLEVFFTGVLEVTGAVVVAAAPVFAGGFWAGGFWAANIVVEATAKAIVSKVFFMAFLSPWRAVLFARLTTLWCVRWENYSIASAGYEATRIRG